MALSVRLAGYNVDADLLREVTDLLGELQEFAHQSSGGTPSSADTRALIESIAERLRTTITREAFTPETLSAAYARISRDPKHVTDLRRAARFGVARARKSNEAIIFGLGHASVAEHATFNFDVSGLSRLAAEELQSHRLVSFTEKSQRYITIGKDYVIPPEAVSTPLAGIFKEVIPELFADYAELYQKLRAVQLPESTEGLKKSQIAELEGKAKEDARYLLPLACSTQMGMTMNARSVEHAMLGFSDHPLQEVRNLGLAIGKAVGRLAPSLVKYTTRGDYPRANREEIGKLAGGGADGSLPSSDSGPASRLVDHTVDGETKLLHALGFSAGQRRGDDDPPSSAPDGIWGELFRRMGEHDPAWREFEFLTMTFEAEVSASCFAQIKRHRMMTLLAQDYRVDDGIVTPPSIAEAGLMSIFERGCGRAAEAARRVNAESPRLTSYLLTNAQRRRVRIHANARELYHFARLRCDAHAQWEIRMLAEQMIGAACQVWPNVFRLACGKDQFGERYGSHYPD